MHNANNTLDNSNPEMAPIHEENALMASDSCAPPCDCRPDILSIEVWHEDILRNNSADDIIGRFSFSYGAGENGVPALMVEYIEILTTEEKRTSDYQVHDITATPLGQFMIKAWKTLYRSRYDALPQTREEWLDWERRVTG